MPCKADYSPAKSFYDVKNLSGLIYIETDKFFIPRKILARLKSI